MIHDETGLLGIAGAAADKVRAGELMHVFCEHFATLATVPVSCAAPPHNTALFHRRTVPKGAAPCHGYLRPEVLTRGRRCDRCLGNADQVTTFVAGLDKILPRAV